MQTSVCIGRPGMYFCTTFQYSSLFADKKGLLFNMVCNLCHTDSFILVNLHVNILFFWFHRTKLGFLFVNAFVLDYYKSFKA